MSIQRRPWRATVRIALLTSVVGAALAVTGSAHAQTSAALGEPERHEGEDSVRVPMPPVDQPRDGRAWASLTFVGVTHQDGGLLSPWTVGSIGVFRGPFAIGMMGAVTDGVLLGGQLGGGMVIDEDGVANVDGTIGPRIELLFGDPGAPLFVAADLWLGVSGGRDSSGAWSTFGLFGGAASFGVHAFVSRELSISPFVQVAYNRWFDLEWNVVQVTLGAQLAGWW